jgi:hypothetical protein
MNAEPPNPSMDVRITITDEDARSFLDRLVKEPEFRAQVEADPRGVLAEHGIEVGPDAAPAQVTLPKEDQIAAFVDALDQSSYLGPRAKNVFGFAILHIVFGAMPLVASRE